MNSDKPQFRPELRLPNLFVEILQTVIFVLVVTVLFDMAIPRSLVDGRSMEPSFENADRLIVSRINFLFMQPQRGDVIVLNSVNAFSEDMLIKRVIGLPGEHIEFREEDQSDGEKLHVLYINGIPIDEPYINEDCRASCSDEAWDLGSSEYFVMGDNRNHSSDSRSFGVVNIDHIVGKVVFRYWPISRIGFIWNPDYPELNR